MEQDSVNVNQNIQARSAINVTKDIMTSQNVKVSDDTVYNPALFFLILWNICDYTLLDEENKFVNSRVTV